jgi:nucleotide-binding universal stress UspA family protein
VRPKTAFTDDPDSGSECFGDETEDDEEEWSDDGQGMFDPVTERNTEQNALIVPVEDGLLMGDMDAEVDADPLGEGVNVVVPPEPYFPSTLNRSSTGGSSRKKGAPKRRKSRNHEALPHSTSRPIFKRDRCTINITQGQPDAIDGKKRSFIVASDMSEESRYAVEWGIGTVLRDGDEMLIVTIVENESKVDPDVPSAADRAVKLRSQQERQGMAYILVRQATSLLQRTRLNVVISCQAWHAKNARHMLLDIVDYNEPTMLIVGSRGLSQIKG